ncbi:damage-control phosphatase ARMT1 family protein [Calderihabitans maritimus]|uniref:damage-control phosphatase ARMT1 family protein n=1 Tax=Calderihabitans maritimus TaxID=1246530 RepID=UPI001EE0A3F7|nr:ARMT1-like domain-containing protein [Calderihabitans maritimus]
MNLECIPCYLKQALSALKQTSLSQEKKKQLLLQLAPLVAELRDDCTPAENSSYILHRLIELSEINDPFATAKRISNRQAQRLEPYLGNLLRTAEDPLEEAIKISVAGNVVDLGIQEDYDLQASLKQALSVPFARFDYNQFQEVLNKAEKVLVLGDNSGEIVFDKFLVAEISGRQKQVFYSVKSAPILNDATLVDAEEVGMTRIARVITTGSNFLGVVPEYCSPEFLKHFKDADLIISKGQANYETLEGTELAGTKTFFLLKAKCPVVATHLGVELGELVFLQNKPVQNDFDTYF